MKYTIYVHDGKAHMDELLAAAFYILHMGAQPQSIERICTKEAAELALKYLGDQSKVFIDCGLIYDNETMFDHHQDKSLPCAAKLICQRFFNQERLGDLVELIDLVDQVDREGIYSLEDFSQLESTKDYMGISQTLLMRSFEGEPLKTMELIVPTLESMVDFEREKSTARLWLEEEDNIKVIPIKGINVLLYLQRPPLEISRGIKAVDGDIIEERSIHCILSFDKSNPIARGLFRTQLGHEKLDFTSAQPKETLFCHNNGFLLKFIPEDEEEWIKIIEDSMVQNS